jgi:AbrB family looped-hinge helix DNA binding protein
MQSFANKTVLTKKSQITLPKKIREFLGVKPGERVAFIIENNAVQIIPLKSKLEENFGKVKPIKKKEDFNKIRKFVEEKIAEENINED